MPKPKVDTGDRVAVSVDEGARISDLSRAYLYRFIANGELPSITVGRRRLLMVDDLTAWLRSHGSSAA